MTGSTWTGYWKPQTATARPPVSAEESTLRARVAELERDADGATKQRAGEAYYAAYDVARAEGHAATDAARAAYRARIAAMRTWPAWVTQAHEPAYWVLDENDVFSAAADLGILSAPTWEAAAAFAGLKLAGLGIDQTRRQSSILYRVANACRKAVRA